MAELPIRLCSSIGILLNLIKKNGKNIALIAALSIAQTFIQHDLIDEYRLILNPVLIGKGQRLLMMLIKNLN